MLKDQALTVVCSGTGYFSRFHYDAWNRIPNATVIGVCNRAVSNAEAFSKEYSIPNFGDNLTDMLVTLKPDLLDIITPPVTHLEAVSVAAQFGVDVICQKPFGNDIEQANEMVAIAKRAGIKLIVHENFRFMPWFREIKTLLLEGFVGRVFNARFNLRPGDGQGPEAYLARQPYFREMDKFLIHETAIHYVDTFRYLFGDVENVYASLQRLNDAIFGEDSGLVLFGMADQVNVVFDGNRLLDHASTNLRRTMGEMLIEGSNGSIRLDGEARLWLREFGQANEHQHVYQFNDDNFGGDCVYQFISHVVDHYFHGSALETCASDYVNNIVIENAIYLSNTKKCMVQLSNNDQA